MSSTPTTGVAAVQHPLLDMLTPLCSHPDQAADFFCRVLNPDVEERLTAQEALHHPWLAEALARLLPAGDLADLDPHSSASSRTASPEPVHHHSELVEPLLADAQVSTLHRHHLEGSLSYVAFSAKYHFSMKLLELDDWYRDMCDVLMKSCWFCISNGNCPSLVPPCSASWPIVRCNQ